MDKMYALNLEIILKSCLCIFCERRNWKIRSRELPRLMAKAQARSSEDAQAAKDLTLCANVLKRKSMIWS